MALSCPTAQHFSPLQPFSPERAPAPKPGGYFLCGQQHSLRGGVIRGERVPLAPVHQVERHRLLLLDERPLLLVRLREDSRLSDDTTPQTSAGPLGSR